MGESTRNTVPKIGASHTVWRSTNQGKGDGKIFRRHGHPKSMYYCRYPVRHCTVSAAQTELYCSAISFNNIEWDSTVLQCDGLRPVGEYYSPKGPSPSHCQLEQLSSTHPSTRRKSNLGQSTSKCMKIALDVVLRGLCGHGAFSRIQYPHKPLRSRIATCKWERGQRQS